MKNKGLSQKQILIISLTALLFVAAAVGADIVMKAMAPVPGASVQAAAPATPSSAVYSDISSSLTDEVEDIPYEPGPSVLNLAYFYPEGADTEDVINSYAGQIYAHISEAEAGYLAEFYDFYDWDPLAYALQSGLSAERVRGKYDPTDPGQDHNDSSTWSVSRFKNVNIAFYDGDGNRINEYSTVKEIISMASVYSYYHDMYDHEAMLEYADSLWEHSHSSNVTLGNVYYCSGCLNRSAEDEAQEAIEQEREQELLREALAKATAKSAGDAALAALGMGGNSQSQETSASSEQNENVQPGDALSSDTSLTGGGDGAGASSAGTEASSSETGSSHDAAATTEVYGSPGYVFETESTEALSSASDTSFVTSGEEGSQAQQQGYQETKASQPVETTAAAQSTVSSGSSGASSDTGSDSGYIVFGNQKFKISTGFGYDGDPVPATEADAAATPGSVPETSAGSASDASSVSGAIADALANSFGSGAAAQNGTSASQTQAAASAPVTAPSQTADSSVQASSAGSLASFHSSSYCPGHIDIYVTIDLKGIDDINGLIAADTIGNDPANFNEQWQGWTEERIAEARELNSQDWFSRYGLTISAINVGRPLSTEEISYYNSLVPQDASQERKDIIDFALNSVGKVPYYWGGKPYGAGYERNNFGTVTWPDERGRVLRGLDCSGWINWVYWSVRGYSLPGESTGTLVGCGRKISRSELRSGDIIIRTGADAHVVMFLAWADSGNMIVIHETGGVTNNVIVSEMAADWPYYRTLIYD